MTTRARRRSQGPTLVELLAAREAREQAARAAATLTEATRFARAVDAWIQSSL